MKLNSFKLLLFLCTSYSFLNAAELRLKDGSNIMGTINKSYRNKISIVTKFAGELSIDMKLVSSFTTDEEHNVEFAKEQKLVGKVGYKNDDVLLIRQDRHKEKISALQNLWPIGAKHPGFVEPVDPWKYNIYLNLNKSSGNTEKESYSGGASMEWKKDDVMLRLFGKFNDGSTNGNKTDREYILGIEHVNTFGEQKEHA